VDIIAFAMGQGASGGGGQGSSIGAFIPLLLFFLLVWIVSRAFYKHGKKKGAQEAAPQSTKCEDCGIIYTKGEKFCRKCGNPLSEGS